MTWRRNGFHRAREVDSSVLILVRDLARIVFIESWPRKRVSFQFEFPRDSDGSIYREFRGRRHYLSLVRSCQQFSRLGRIFPCDISAGSDLVGISLRLQQIDEKVQTTLRPNNTTGIGVSQLAGIASGTFSCTIRHCNIHGYPMERNIILWTTSLGPSKRRRPRYRGGRYSYRGRYGSLLPLIGAALGVSWLSWRKHRVTSTSFTDGISTP